MSYNLEHSLSQIIITCIDRIRLKNVSRYLPPRHPFGQEAMGDYAPPNLLGKLRERKALVTENNSPNGPT
jgi:hypothetical protein